ncbi:protein of unknown function [Cupriavidus taiwanensis]|nr:protein of unknown function [Cupriavidus taiwanensis]
MPNGVRWSISRRRSAATNRDAARPLPRRVLDAVLSSATASSYTFLQQVKGQLTSLNSPAAA